MRLAGKTLEEITEYLNKNQYSVRDTEGNRRIYKFDIKRVAAFLKDPAYTGVLIHGDNVKDLTEVYDFVPAISVDDFLKINKASPFSKSFKATRRQFKPESIKADLMRHMVICQDCGEGMSAGLTTKKTEDETRKYFYYRCETEGCKSQNKSVRAKVIIDFICDYLATHNFANRQAYDHYTSEIKNVFAGRSASLKQDLESLKAGRRQVFTRLEKIKSYLLTLTDKDVDMKNVFKKDFDTKQVELIALDAEIAKTTKIIENSNLAILDYPTFLELFNKLPEFIRKTKSMAELDQIIKKIFSNFVVKGKKVQQTTLNQPFDRLVKVVDFSSGGDGGARTRNLSRDRRVL